MAERVAVKDADFAEGVRCVVMPCCGFTYDAIHEDDVEGGGYSCPQCGDDAGTSTLRGALEAFLMSPYVYPPAYGPKGRVRCQLCNAAQRRTGELHHERHCPLPALEAVLSEACDPKEASECG